MVHFGRFLVRDCVPEWQSRYISYRRLKDALEALQAALDAESSQPDVRLTSQLLHVHWSSPGPEGTPRTEVAPQTPAWAAERAFFMLLDEQVAKADAFFRLVEEQLTERLSEVVAALRWRRQAGTEPQAAPAEHPEQPTSDKTPLVALPEAHKVGLPFALLSLPRFPLPHVALPHLPLLGGPDDHARRQAHSDALQLRRGLAELYRGTGLLSSFGALNRTACVKILKKHDKCAGMDASDVYLHFVDQCAFGAGEPRLEALRRAIEREYEAIELELHPVGTMSAASRREARHKALAKLRPPPPHGSAPATLLAAGVAVGGAGVLGLHVAVLVGRAGRHPAALPSMVAVLPLLRGPLLWAAHVGGHGAAVAVWRHFRISHAFIFGGIPGTEMHAAEFALLAGLAASFWLGCWAVTLGTAVTALDAAAVAGGDSAIRAAAASLAWTPGPAPPLLLFFALLTSLMPLPEQLCGARLRRLAWPPHMSRSTLSGSVVRSLTAPLSPVTLPDFFLADQLTSQQQGLQDLLYSLAFYLNSGALDGRGGLRAGPKLLVCLLPNWLRLAQCGRRLRDEGLRLHAVNAAKYGMGALALVVRALHDSRPPSSSLAGLTATCLLVSSVFSCIWDLKMDWALLSPGASHPGLRDVLLLREPAIYYVIMAVNAALRLTWCFSLPRWPGSSSSPLVRLMLPTLLALLEIGRRCVWSVLRIENEHVANTGALRATTAVPLPEMRVVTGHELLLSDDGAGHVEAEHQPVSPVRLAPRSRGRAVRSEHFSWAHDGEEEEEGN